jgi:hypothetical protein
VAVVVGEAAVRLRPETSTFKGEAESEIDSSLPGVAKKAAGFFAAAFAAEKVGEFLKESVTQASDLSESTSKVGVVFGARPSRSSTSPRTRPRPRSASPEARPSKPPGRSGTCCAPSGSPRSSRRT